MQISSYDEVRHALLRAFRTVIPSPEGREDISWRNLHIRSAYIVPFFFLAYLARRKDTYHIRLLILPTVLALSLKGTFGFRNLDPEADYETWFSGLGCLAVVAKSLDYALTPEGILKIEERALSALNDSPTDGHPKVASRVLPLPLSDASELVFAFRGIGWQFGKDTSVPPEHRPLTRRGFLLVTFFSGIKNFLILDSMLSVLRQLPGIGTIHGGSLFYHNLPLAQRYIVSSAIMVPVSLCFLSGFAVTDALTSLIGVGILHQSPGEWPPLMNEPWRADSLHDFWGRRWHQLWRRTFLVLGGIPGRWIAGKVGMIMGSFLASAFYHEAPLYLIDRSFDHRVTLFFALNGVGVLIEWILYKCTGRKVSGFTGRIWTWTFILGFGQFLVDAWFTRGLAGSRIVPAEISLTRIWLKPLLDWLSTQLRAVLE